MHWCVAIASSGVARDKARRFRSDAYGPGTVAHPTYGMQPLAPSGPAVPPGPYGISPVAPPGPAAPSGPYGIEPLAPSGPAVPPGPYGIWPVAPPGPAVPMSAHGVPSALTHGGGSASEAGANTIEAAAAPAKNTEEKRLAIMCLAYPLSRRLKTPAGKVSRASQAKRLMYFGGSTRSTWASGAHGQRGTTARPFSFSMASTMARTPVSVSTMSMVVADLAVISDSI